VQIDHRPVFFAHLGVLCGSAIRDDVPLEFAFSISEALRRGEPEISSSLVLLLLVDRLSECTSFGNVDLRGVSAVTTFRADLRMLSRISHDRFFARYHSTAEMT
jgi:hypothetical protein